MVVASSEKQNYLTRVSNGINTFDTDVLPQKGGKGQDFRPHELLCAALASCMNITTRMVLDKLNIIYDDVNVTVELDIKDENSSFIYNIDIIGDISENKKQEVIRLAENCPVRKTLSKELSFIRK